MEETQNGAVRLEHRLTKIESGMVAISGQVQVVEGLVRTQNGKVAEHIKKDEEWMAEHTLDHVQESGYHKGLIASLIAIATVVGFLVSTLSYPIARFIFG